MALKNNKEPQLKIIGGMYKGRSLVFHPRQDLSPTSHRLRTRIFDVLIHNGLWGPALEVHQPDQPNQLDHLSCEKNRRTSVFRVGDFFAGTGALGFEALSRGASHVVFIDQEPAMITMIQQSAQQFSWENCISVILAHLPEDLYKVKKRYESFLENPLIKSPNRSIETRSSFVDGDSSLGESLLEKHKETFSLDLIFLDPPYGLWENLCLMQRLVDLMNHLDLLKPGGLICCEHDLTQNIMGYFSDFQHLKTLKGPSQAFQIFQKL
jgi:16S rRNA G966 N2-methylase RsmD